jgi:hypothetical protein
MHFGWRIATGSSLRINGLNGYKGVPISIRELGKRAAVKKKRKEEQSEKNHLTINIIILIILLMFNV